MDQCEFTWFVAANSKTRCDQEATKIADGMLVCPEHSSQLWNDEAWAAEWEGREVNAEW